MSENNNAVPAARASSLEKFIAKNQVAIDAAKADAVSDKETATVTIGAEHFYNTLPEGVTRETADAIANHVKNHPAVVIEAGKDHALDMLKTNADLAEVTITGQLGEFGNASLLVKRAGAGFNEGEIVHGSSVFKVTLDATRGDVGPVKAIRNTIKDQAAVLFGGK